MYPVSDEFLSKIQENARQYYWTGTLTTTLKTYDFNYNNIVKGSSSITRQCSGNTEIDIGSVYSSELTLQLILDTERYTLEGAEIEIYYHLILEDDTVETVPMGIFEVVEAVRHTKYIDIRAYDYMLKFDKALPEEKFSYGKAYDFVTKACEKCGVELATPEEDFKQFANADYGFDVYYPNDMQTYRDLLFYVTQASGCVAQINREGGLELKKYQYKAVLSVPIQQRFESKYSDFRTRYTAITHYCLVDKKQYLTGEGEGEEGEEVEVTGLTIDVGANPLLQKTKTVDPEEPEEPEETRQLDIAYILRLSEVLLAVKGISYTPFESTVIGNPALDPMDVIKFTGGHADDDALSCITHITYNIGGKQKLKCVGTNPKLAKAKSSVQKEVDSLVTDGVGGSGCECLDHKIVYLRYENSRPHTVESSPVSILSKDFSTILETTVMLHATVGITVTGVQDTAEVTLLYKMNDGLDLMAEQREYYKTVKNGNNFLTLFYCTLPISGETLNQIQVFLSISSGTISIERRKIQATIWGQYIVDDNDYWNGVLDLYQDITPLKITNTNFTMMKFTAEVLPLVADVTKADLLDTVKCLPITNTNFEVIT